MKKLFTNKIFVSFCLALVFIFSMACNVLGWTAVPTTIYTPQGTAVSALAMSGEMSTAEYDAYIYYTATNFPNAVMVRNPTIHYNCHSYAWYSRSTSNCIWINSPEQSKFINDGSYPYYTVTYNGQIPSYSSALRVVYCCDDHSANKYNGTLTYFFSKWGKAGLMKHTPAYCPYDSSMLAYYVG